MYTIQYHIMVPVSSIRITGGQKHRTTFGNTVQFTYICVVLSTEHANADILHMHLVCLLFS